MRGRGGCCWEAVEPGPGARPGASRTELSSTLLLATLNVFGNRGSVSSYRVAHPQRGPGRRRARGAGPIREATVEAVSVSLITGPPGQLCQGSESRLPKPASKEPSVGSHRHSAKFTPRIPGVRAPA